MIRATYGGNQVNCPFCELGSRELVWESDLVVAMRDGFPVSPGHTLVLTRRHVATYFDASAQEQAEIWRGVAEIKTRLDAEFCPDGYNVGFNAEPAAGQTVMHVHVHVIPRFGGDMDDPRGGVRGVVPGKRVYEVAGAKQVAEGGSSYTRNSFIDFPQFVPGENRHFAGVLRRALAIADEADIVAAFIQPGGLAQIIDYLTDALERGAQVRLLTGDYMNTTSADALRTLLSLQSGFPDQFRPFFFDGGGKTSFHAKAYIFLHGVDGIAFVGSSNLSRTALTDGIEWNLRAVASDDGLEFTAIRSRFEQLLNSSRMHPLTREIIDRYEQRAKIPSEPDPRPAAPNPHIIQEEALSALRRIREEGARAALVVMATGLGKTFLSALDFQQLEGGRALFIAHREEILTQALESWQRVFPEKNLGLLVGDQREPDADILFASIQTLSRKQHLNSFKPDHFDYIVVDEIHHAAASTYRRVMGYFEPKFLLGLTATPDRMDGASILELCHDNLAYRAGLVRGISAQLLVPFRYFGVRDEIDFTNIPWRGRWSTDDLTRAAATEGRAEQSLREYRKHAPLGKRRTLAFCCSVAHADYMAEFFRQNGIPAAAVHSGPSSASRAKSLQELREGELEILCAVDVFNEGLDVPDINVVLMLRPTESPIIFLQQLGRGLRRPELSDKTHLTIVDFIGNHRSFLIKPQALIALTGQDVPGGAALEVLRRQGLDLPEGCSVDIETGVIDMLEQVSRLSRDDMLIYEYCNLRDSHGRRPTAAELLATGLHMKPVLDRYGSWFDFVAKQGDPNAEVNCDLTADELRVLRRHGAWFKDLMSTRMERSYKMVTLRAMLERGALRGRITVDDLVHQAARILGDDLVLGRELEETRRKPDPIAALGRVWRGENGPIKAWVKGRNTSRPWFALEGHQFRFLGDVAEGDAETFDEMTAELVELRLAEHRDRLRSNVTELAAPIRIRVSHANGNPILRYDRARRPDIPKSGSDVEVLVGQETYFFGFRKIAINTAVREPGGPNELATLMRRWFGPGAGQPGSAHYVLLSQTGGCWVLTASQEDKAVESVVDLDQADLRFYSDLKVACGDPDRTAGLGQAENRLGISATIDTDPERQFLVRASGDSMNGGDTPIEDGDLLLCEWLSATTPAQVEGKICLFAGATNDGHSYATLKVPVQSDSGWLLRSTNTSIEDQLIDADVTLRPIARFVQVVEARARLEVWGKYARETVVEAFGQMNDRSWQVGHRDIEINGQGHSILFVTLRKDANTPASQRYADRFISPTEFQWESQASTTPQHKKGRSILNQRDNGQTIHLFCRYQKRNSEEFIYCGPLRYERHQGSKPIRVWFRLEQALPERLWRLWEG